MALFVEESEDSLLDEEEMRVAQRKSGYSNRRFGAFALMKSSTSAEAREMRAVERQRRSLERQKRKIDKIRRVRSLAKRIFTWERYESR